MSTIQAAPAPLLLTAPEAARDFFAGSRRLLQRATAAGWLRPLVGGGHGRPLAYHRADLEAVVDRLRRGEQPPLLPSEAVQAAKRKGGE